MVTLSVSTSAMAQDAFSIADAAAQSKLSSADESIAGICAGIITRYTTIMVAL